MNPEPSTHRHIGVEQFGATILPDVPGAAVTGQTVRNWIREGMPGAQRDERGGGGRWLIVDPDAARAWCERVKAEAMAALRAGRRANAPPAPHTPPTPVSIGRGGARAGAGRKKGTATPGAAWRKTELGAVATAVEPIIPPTPPAPAATASLSTAAAEKLEHQVAGEREYARKLKIENDLKAGLLLRRSDVEKSWTTLATIVGNALSALVSDVVDRVLLSGVAPADARPAIAAAVIASTERTKGTIVAALRSTAGAVDASNQAVTGEVPHVEASTDRVAGAGRHQGLEPHAPHRAPHPAPDPQDDRAREQADGRDDDHEPHPVNTREPGGDGEPAH